MSVKWLSYSQILAPYLFNFVNKKVLTYNWEDDLYIKLVNIPNYDDTETKAVCLCLSFVKIYGLVRFIGLWCTYQKEWRKVLQPRATLSRVRQGKHSTLAVLWDTTSAATGRRQPHPQRLTRKTLLWNNNTRKKSVCKYGYF